MRLRHNIHREGVGGEGDGAVVGFHGAHKLEPVFALVPDVEHLAVGKVGVGNGHHHVAAALGLPLAATLVDGDVVGSQGLLAVGIIALHRGCLHRGVGGHRARHRKVHAGAVAVPQALVGHHRRRGGVMANGRTGVVPRGLAVRGRGRRHRRRHIHRSEKEQKSKDRQQKSLHFSLGRCTCHTVYVLYYYLIINML